MTVRLEPGHSSSEAEMAIEDRGGIIEASPAISEAPTFRRPTPSRSKRRSPWRSAATIWTLGEVARDVETRLQAIPGLVDVRRRSTRHPGLARL
ncbi:MAG: hypothetical protein R3F17_14185 [Planctomycetota bacterium]